MFNNGVDEDGQWKLYEAYNELHGLAQEFSTPFDAPAVLVVGHQTDGKSALVEALMGFQFNHVGGGTKTRRPITLHMKFNPDCDIPLCRLLSESDPSIPQDKSLHEIQAYIEAENMRLERESYQFSSKEIIIRIEYKHCPNLTIIDTPGLIAPAPARKNRALQAQARAVESLVRAKMQHKEFIILCLEDCSDWSNATTRRVVMQIDPELSRTVVVSTKLDTKIPQFARASDVEVFLSPPASTLDGFMLGDSPFFTSVPSGRVGSGHESVYRCNDEFKQAISLRERDDKSALEEKLGRSLSKQEISRIGVSSLKLFLEELLQKRYMDSVPLIIPLLEKEYRSTTRKLNEINQELSTLDEIKLKEKGRTFHDMFLTKLSLLLKGTVVAPPEKFGETLQDERVNGGAFIGTDGLQFPHKLIPDSFIGDVKGNTSRESDIEMGPRLPRSSSDVALESFYKQIQEVEKQVDKLSVLLQNLKEANEESKSVTKASSMKAIRKRMEKDVDEVGKIARNIKVKIEAINKDNLNNRQKPGCGKGTAIDRSRMNMTNALTKKFKDLMTEFQTLRQRIEEEYREVVERRVITVTGTRPDEETINHLIETGNSEQIFQKAMQESGRGQVMNTLEEIQERHDAVKEIEKKLLDLHQIYLDMAVLVEAQGDILDNIESQVTNAVDHVQSGTNALQNARKLQKNSRKCMCIAIILLLLIVAIIVLSVLRPWKN